MWLLRKSSVTRLCRSAGVKLLLHSTHLYANLPQILRDGKLLSAGDLKAAHGDSAARFLHDPNRYEQFAVGMTYINCSLTEPNYELLYKRSKAGWQTEWCHLELELKLLDDPGTRFSPVSAAQERGRYVEAGAEGLRALFAPEVGGVKRAGLRKNLPTHPQAEVLIQGPIPLALVNAIHVCNEPVQQEAARLAEQQGAQLPILISPALFTWPTRLRK